MPALPAENRAARPSCSRARGEVGCAKCKIRLLSVCAALDENELYVLEALAQQTVFEPKKTLFIQDEPADAIYNITGGVVRLYKLLPDGRRQIIGFALPGNFLGLSMADRYGFSADAVVPVKACRFSREGFSNLLDDKPHLLRRLHELATHELTLAQDQMVVLGRRSAEEKVASLLIGLRDRWARVNEAAAHRSMQAEAYVISAVRRFEREASDADWTTVISAVTAGTNPGSACLRRMVEHVLKQDEQGPR